MMGLDITVYKNLRVADVVERDEYGDLDYDKHWQPGSSMESSERHFPGRAEGINSEVVYEWEDQFDFRAGGYSGYGFWRSQLNDFKGEESFQELIDFADNEGVIGYVVAKKLAEDFDRHMNEAKIHANQIGLNGEQWLNKYDLWKEAFEFASDNGAVEFR